MLKAEIRKEGLFIVADNPDNDKVEPMEFGPINYQKFQAALDEVENAFYDKKVGSMIKLDILAKAGR